MKCPKCSNIESKVIDSRTVREDTAIRRRRECTECSHRFTTYEDIEIVELMVEKNNGATQRYKRNKLKDGISIALGNRHISLDDIETMINEIYDDMITASGGSGSIKSSKIGEIVMEKLKKTDEVAYIRFASVYRKFKDVKEFMEELQNIVK